MNFRSQPQSLGATLTLGQPISIRFDQLFDPFTEVIAGIDHQQAGRPIDRAVGPRDADQLLRATQQITLLVRLGDIFVGTGRQSTHPRTNVRFQRQQDYRDRSRIRFRLQLGEELDAVAVGQLDVEHDQVEPRFEQCGAAFRQRRGESAGIAATFEGRLQVHADRQAVVNYQYA